MKTKVHTFAVTVRLNKPCIATVARRAAADVIYGKHYPTSYDRRQR